MNSQTQLYATISAGLKKLDALPLEEQIAFFQRIGIFTADRKLSPRYGGRRTKKTKKTQPKTETPAE